MGLCGWNAGAGAGANGDELDDWTRGYHIVLWLFHLNSVAVFVGRGEHGLRGSLDGDDDKYGALVKYHCSLHYCYHH